jgi:hypothetical protein
VLKLSLFSLTRRASAFLFSLLIAKLLATALPAAAQSLPSRDFINQTLEELSGITGMPVRHQLRFESITRPEISKYLEERLRKTIKPEELEREQAAFEFLGFIPAGFDLRKLTIDLMTEQAAAFYDYNKKALFLSDWTPGSMRDTAVVHELAHALADQNFHLGRYERKAEYSSEQTSARQAVIEGQASYLMFAYAALPTGKPSPDIHPKSASFDDAVAPTNGEYPVFDGAPLYFRMELIFPYTWGVAFQSALVDRLGEDGYAAPFRHPPVSTQQVLHPELYFTDARPAPCKLPKPPHGYRIIFDGDMGELDHRVLIQQYLSLKEAKRMSPKWRGGAFQLLENKKDHRRILEYASEWSDEKSASEFLDTYRRCLEGKSQDIKVDAESELGFRGRNTRGYFRVTRTGVRINAIEGSPDPL